MCKKSHNPLYMYMINCACRNINILVHVASCKCNIMCTAILTLPPVPGQPQNVQATPISSSEVRVQWDPPDEEGLDGYVVLYEPAPGVSCEAVQGGEVRVEGGEVTEWVVTGLEGGMNYSLRVRASNFAGDGEPSEPATATTMEEGNGSRVAPSSSGTAVVP